MRNEFIFPETENATLQTLYSDLKVSRSRRFDMYKVLNKQDLQNLSYDYRLAYKTDFIEAEDYAKLDGLELFASMTADFLNTPENSISIVVFGLGKDSDEVKPIHLISVGGETKISILDEIFEMITIEDFIKNSLCYQPFLRVPTPVNEEDSYPETEIPNLRKVYKYLEDGNTPYEPTVNFMTTAYSKVFVERVLPTYLGKEDLGIFKENFTLIAQSAHSIKREKISSMTIYALDENADVVMFVLTIVPTTRTIEQHSLVQISTPIVDLAAFIKTTGYGSALVQYF